MTTSDPLTASTAANAPVDAPDLGDILEECGAGVCAIDSAERCTFINRRALRMLGTPASPAAIIGRRLWDALPHLVGTEVQQQTVRSLAQRVSQSTIHRIPGRDVWVEVRQRAISNGVSFFLREVPEQLAMGQFARKNQENLARLLRELLAEPAQALSAETPFRFAAGTGDAATGHSSEQQLDTDFAPSAEQAADPLQTLRIPSGAVKFTLPVDGDVYDMRAAPLRFAAHGESDDWAAIVFLAENATRRKANERALREAETRFRSAFDDAAIPMALAAPDGRFLRANRAYTRLVGYSAAELQDRLIYSIVSEEHAAQHFQMRNDTLNGVTESYRTELRLKHRNGSEVWCDLNGSAVRDDAGEVIYTVTQFQDITDRKRTESDLREFANALRRSEERFRALTEYSTDVVSVVGPDGTLLYVSPSVRNVLGYTVEEATGGNGFAAIHPEDLALTTIWLQRLSEADSESRLTYRYRHKNGSWRWLETTGSNQVENPAVLGFVINSRDVTERVQLEQQIIQTEKLAALGELVAGVAHEINNPLAAISGHAQLLTIHQDEVVRQDAQRIQKMVLRISRIVRSLRSFARAGLDELRTVCRLNEVVDSALDVIGNTLRSADIEIVLDLDAESATVMADSGQMEQVLVNLLANAEYALRVRPAGERRICVSTRVRDGLGVLTVEDNGSGIPSAVQGRIFDPFFTTKRAGEGTGLGLYVSQSILVAHNGSIRMESVEGQGARFVVSLPLIGA